MQEDLEREGMAMPAARELYEIVSRRRSTDETLRELASHKGAGEVYDQGVQELERIVQAIRLFGVPEGAFAVDLGVVRGLDYYTGTIYETTLAAQPDIGSICSGGRYDDLASYFTDTRLPGVGISIGLTRLFARLKEAGLLQPPGRTPAEALVTAMDERLLERYLSLARALRDAGVNTEVYLEPAKLKHQLAYANRKGFRVALIAGENEAQRNVVQVKDLATAQAEDVPVAEVVAAVKRIVNRAGAG